MGKIDEGVGRNAFILGVIVKTNKALVESTGTGDRICLTYHIYDNSQ